VRNRLVVGIALLGAVATGYVFLARSWHLRWGATEQESGASLSGDELLADPDLAATRGITIRAPAAKVWPWVVQLGQGRGGFYSYEALENLVGCDIHNADNIVPEWQRLEVGNEIKLYPGGGLRVAALEPGRVLVLRGGGVPVETGAPPYDFTWAFVLKEQTDGTTRLLVRERYCYKKRWAALLVEPVELVSFVMTQRMLRGIRERAERARSRSEE
jgi:hypothetical protein